VGEGFNIKLIAALPALLLALSCAESGGTVMVDVEYNLTCPDDTAVGCGSLAPETCLGSVGQRAIVGARGETSCTGEPIVASCEAVNRPDGLTVVFLEANIGNEFAFELAGATVDDDGQGGGQTVCNVTITEDGAVYDLGGCGTEEPSMEQPCQLSNVSAEGGEVVFDLECKSLINRASTNGFDVGAVGGGPTTIRFSNCSGF
jgi:hypothetical protein